MNIIKAIKSPVGTYLFRCYARIRHGIKFSIASPENLDALYRFRFNIYTGEGYVKPEDYPDKRFVDQYDPFSTNVITLKNGRIIGCGRVTHYSDLGFPVNQFFRITLPAEIKEQSMVEMGRFMVDPLYRGESRLVTLGMSLQLRSYVRSDDSIKWLVAFMSEKVRNIFHEIVPFTVLEQMPADKEQLEARTMRQGYWDQGEINPVIAEASQLL